MTKATRQNNLFLKVEACKATNTKQNIFNKHNVKPIVRIFVYLLGVGTSFPGLFSSRSLRTKVDSEEEVDSEDKYHPG